MAYRNVSLSHRRLGNVVGVGNSKVEKFLGLKYADIPARFEDSILYEGTDYDATCYSPSVIQPRNSLEHEYEVIQHALPIPAVCKLQDEFKSLTLNITRPAKTQTHLLPVFVWIHGGRFFTGSNSWPHYDHGKFVELSMEMRKPVIGISINYRLGAFGFLTSMEMFSAGYTGNYAIKDQRNALEWVKKNIEGFAGDPQNITVIGESAGGASGTYQLHRNEALFKRLVCMGGQGVLMPPQPLIVHDEIYSSLVEGLGLEDLSGNDRIQKLKTLPAEQITAQLTAWTSPKAVLDGEWFHEPVRASVVQDPNDKTQPGKLQWCESMMIGDCGADGNTLFFDLQAHKTGIQAKFSNSLCRCLRDKAAIVTRMLDSYGIAPPASEDAAFIALHELLNDVAFYAPTVMKARGWPRNKSCYLYHFNVPNTWPGPLKGEANHILDIAYLFQNYNEHLSSEGAAVAREFAGKVIAFVNGEQPWAPFSTDSGKACIISAGGCKVRPAVDKEGVGRRQKIWQFIDEIGFDRLWGAFQVFLEECWTL